MADWAILEGDCVEQMRAMPEASVDAVVCDPPYGLGFMGQKWDTYANETGRAPAASAKFDHVGGNHNPSNAADAARTRRREAVVFGEWCEQWATEALRVLKPGGHLLAFGGTRTYHRLACAVEDAGFEIRDTIAWQHMEGVFCACDSPVRGVRTAGDTPAEQDAQPGDGDVLSPVQWSDPGCRVGDVRAHGAGGMDGRQSGELPREDKRRAEPGMEGRRDAVAQGGQLPVDQVRPSASMGGGDGPEGWLRDGAPAAHGPDHGPLAGADGSGAPPRSRPDKQRAGEPGAVAVEWIPQGGGAWPGCPRCGKPLAPPFFGGPLIWEYGSGFPKSLDVGKAIDAAAGATREVVGKRNRDRNWRGVEEPDHERYAATRANDPGGSAQGHVPDGRARMVPVEAPATPDAERWQGWGTALKPSHEPIVVARKPLVGTVAANVLAHGTGALNVDACRIGFAGQGDEAESKGKNQHAAHGNGARANAVFGADLRDRSDYDAPGRWPANVVLSHTDDCVPAGTRRVKTGVAINRNRGADKPGIVAGAPRKVLPEDQTYADADGTEEMAAWQCAPGCPVAALDEQTGERRSAGEYVKGARGGANDFQGPASINIDGLTAAQYSDSGGASRFFYCAKASSAERNAGLDGFANRCVNRYSPKGQGPLPQQTPTVGTVERNVHPTVKPIDLMRWLVRLVTPPGGLVLDPFAGSGTTGCAATLEGFRFVGIEREPEYAAIARARIAWWAKHPDGMELVDRLEHEKQRKAKADAGQLGLFGA